MVFHVKDILSVFAISDLLEQRICQQLPRYRPALPSCIPVGVVAERSRSMVDVHGDAGEPLISRAGNRGREDFAGKA